jgi:hypothetical protein
MIYINPTFPMAVPYLFALLSVADAIYRRPKEFHVRELGQKS